MPATRVLGTGFRGRDRSELGALTTTTSFDSGGTTFDYDTVDSTSTTDDTNTTETVEEPTTEPVFEPIPSDVENYMDTLRQRKDQLQSLEGSHSGKWFWSEFVDKVSNTISSIDSAIAEALNTRSITRPGLPDRALTLINSIKDRSDDEQPLPDHVKKYISTLKSFRDALNTLESNYKSSSFWSGVSTEVQDRKSAIDNAINSADSQRTIIEPDLTSRTQSTIDKIQQVATLRSTSIPLSAWNGGSLSSDVVNHVKSVDQSFVALQQIASQHRGAPWWEQFQSDVNALRTKLIESGKKALSSASVPDRTVVKDVKSLISEIEKRASIPEEVVTHARQATKRLSDLRSVEEKYKGTEWWSTFSSRVSTLKQRLEKSANQSMSQASVVDQSVTTDTETLISEIETTNTQSQNEVSPSGDNKQSGDQTKDSTSTTTNATVQTKSAGVESNTALLVGGGILIGGLLLYSNN